MSDPSTDNSDETANKLGVSRALGQASVEVGSFAAPVMVIALAGVFTWRPAVFWLTICGCAGLSLSLSASRATEGITIIRWPHPSSMPDKVTTVIAYNATIGIGTIVSTVAWLTTDWFLIGVIVAAILPLWLLKHIRVILTLDESEAS